MAKVNKRYPSGGMDVRVGGRYARLLLPPDDPDHISVDDLDTEELSKGMLKDKDGKFRGRPPKFLPREIFDAMKREYYTRVNDILEEKLPEMTKTMLAIAQDETQDGATRLKACIYVYERFMGKVPDRVEVAPGSRVDKIVDQILFDVEESRAAASANTPAGRTVGDTAVEAEISAAADEMERAPRRHTRRSPAARMRERR